MTGSLETLREPSSRGMGVSPLGGSCGPLILWQFLALGKLRIGEIWGGQFGAPSHETCAARAARTPRDNADQLGKPATRFPSGSLAPVSPLPAAHRNDCNEGDRECHSSPIFGRFRARGAVVPGPRVCRFFMLGNLLTLFFGRNYTGVPGRGSFPNLPIPIFQTAFSCWAVSLFQQDRASLPADNVASCLAPSMTRESS